MLEAHAPHETIHTWKDFFIHIATITVGLLIAVGLEQMVEYLHHRHQAHQLQEDLREEARRNEMIIDRDLHMQDLEGWFEEATKQAGAALPVQGRVRLTLPPSPCLPGSLGTSAIRYFAPSEAVWTTARENGLTGLLPADEARMYARLAHNYALLSSVRDDVFHDCQSIVAQQQRFATAGSVPGQQTWTMTPEQAERLATVAADTKVNIQGLLFRLRWSLVYEQGIGHGENSADEHLMTINQERFEDPPKP